MSSPLTVTVRSLSLVLVLAATAAAQPPPLEPPALEPPSGPPPRSEQTPPPPKPVARTPSAPKPEHRPMLAIPGVTAPSARHSIPTTGAATTPPPDASPGALPLPSDFPHARTSTGLTRPSLDGPPGPPPYDSAIPAPDLLAPRRPSNGAVEARPGAIPRMPPGETIPLTIEPLDEPPTAGRDNIGRPSAPRSPDSRSSSSRPVRPDDEPIRPRPMPRREPGLFGRLLGLQPTSLPPAREEPRTAEKKEPGRNDDQDPDIIARRKIERQIRATVGDRVRYFDVSVDGRNVVIFAQPSRFWFRRSVRRSIETLPSIQGYRTRIEVAE